MEYVRTRHNAGFEVVNILARRLDVRFSSAYRALAAETNLDGEKLVLLKPMTYMNLSGDAVAPCLARFRASCEDLIVVYDDMDLETGRLRIRERGSAGGHNGMRSIIDRLGTSDFDRLRIGIGHRGSAAGHVLSRFSPEERPVMKEAFERAADALEVMVKEGTVCAMNRYN